MRLSDIPTPALVLDKGLFLRNIARMRQKLAALDTPLRPHLKTCKSAKAADYILEGQPGGITVSTLKEAEYFLIAGITDILYAVAISPDKLDQIYSLQQSGARMTLILDDIQTAIDVAQKGEQLGDVFSVLIEIDSDGHRAGIESDDQVLIRIGQLLHTSPNIEFRGIMTHAGASYGCRSETELMAMARQERNALRDAAKALREAGLPCDVISMGSTPTALFSENLDGITEIRAGVFVFQDLVMANLGVCQPEDIALSVLGTVISHKQKYQRLIIDAGGLALSKDHGLSSQNPDYGYGQACHASSGRIIPGLIVHSTNQEHGLLDMKNSEAGYADMPIGSRLRILPNHACMTAAAYDKYHVIDGSDEIVDIWERCNGW